MAGPLTWRGVFEKNAHVLLAIRHGETTYNVENRCATTTDVALTSVGRDDARLAAKSLVGVEIDAAFTSPMGRARETAELILPESAPEAIVDERLREPPAGPFEGLDFGELWSGRHPLSKQFEDYEARGIAPEGAEPVGETVEKAKSFLDRLGDVPGHYVAVSHGGLIRVMATVLLGLDPLNSGRLKVDNCHAIAFKWYERPPHQLLAVNLPPDGRGVHAAGRQGEVEVTSIPKRQ